MARPIVANRRGIFDDSMPAKLVTLNSVRGKLGLFRCSVCRAEFRGQDVLKQFIAHLRKDHRSKDGAKR